MFEDCATARRGRRMATRTVAREARDA